MCTLVSMPCLGLSPFLQKSMRTVAVCIGVSMPCLGLSPFLRSPLGTRINRGHNLETIHVIVRQFSFAPIFTPFFPSLGIPALFHLKWFVFRHFYYTCFFIPAQGIFAFSACFSISLPQPLIFPFPYCHKGILSDAFMLSPLHVFHVTSLASFQSFLQQYRLTFFIMKTPFYA